eukprot:4876952-Prorocentrum_lima.AAC.1
MYPVCSAALLLVVLRAEKGFVKLRLREVQSKSPPLHCFPLPSRPHQLERAAGTDRCRWCRVPLGISAAKSCRKKGSRQGTLRYYCVTLCRCFSRVDA